ncbi:MAG: hypothetical protein DHS20C01_04030 [marine bacterium B5-7]|nr:MAG: hypothetical protein DHS20C01_04030 [marine bacterium B5-7]
MLTGPSNEIKTRIKTALWPDVHTRHEQLALIFEEAINSAGILLVASSIFALVIWDYVPKVMIIAWMLTFAAVIGFRYQIAMSFARQKKRDVENKRWVYLVFTGVTLSGLLWGFSGLFLHYTPDSLDIVIVLTVTVVTITAISFQAHYLPVFLVYLSCTTLPMIYFVSLELTSINAPSILLYALFFIAVAMSAYRFNHTIYERLSAQRQAAVLSERLSDKNLSLTRELKQRRRTEKALALNQEYLNAIFFNAPLEIYLKDKEGRYIKINREFERLFNVTDEQAKGKFPADIHEDALAAAARAHDLEVLNNGETRIIEQSCKLPGIDDDSEHTLLTVKFPIKTKGGSVNGVGAVVLDITRQKEIDQQLRLSRERFRDFAEIASDFYFEIDESLKLTFSSARGRILNGVPMEELVSTRDRQLSSGHIVDGPEWTMHLARRNNHRPYEFEVSFMRNDDKEIRLHIKVNPITNEDGKFRGFRGIARDITREYKLAQDISYNANHDPLTGQLNRRKFLQYVDEFIEDARKSNHSHVLCFLDLDRFKFVNDSSGHVAGDALLVEVSNTIQKQLRSGDRFGRMGGDEFGILLRECSTNRADSIASHILKGLQEIDFKWGERSHSISASIGISIIDSQVGSATSLLIDADQACYRAKELGEGRIFVSNRSGGRMPQRIQHYRQTDWLDALDKSLLQLYAQSIVSLNDEGSSYNWNEILVRLVDADGNAHSPEYFIPYAERFGQITRLDQWVVANTFEYIQTIDDLHNRRFSINLSGASLHSDRLRDDILELFATTVVKPENICFELTETSAIKNLGLAKNFIERIRSEGCTIALDDFGTGLASFSYLKHFPVDFVKIDGSFIQDLDADAYNPIFVESIASVASAMNIRTVGECVESAQILERLTKIGIDYAQGNAVGSPQPLTDLHKSLS